jgi:hypothetical protein
MHRPSAFAHHRFLGDKRTQQVYDLEEVADEDALAVVLDELMSSDAFLCFGPDTLAEARNRGYKLQKV